MKIRAQKLLTRRLKLSVNSKTSKTDILPAIFILLSSFILCAVFSCQTGPRNSLFQLLTPDQTGIDFSNLLEEDDSFNIIEYLYFYNGGGVAVGDINNDGYPDIYFSSNRHSNKLYLNLGKNSGGALKFQDITEKAGVSGLGNWSTGVNMVDINGDGWLDIYQCEVGGYKHFKGRNQLFINQGCDQLVTEDSSANDLCIPSFRENAAAYGLDYSGFASQTAFFDYDLDGDLDMYLLCHSVHSSDSYRDTTTTRSRNSKIGDKLFENKSGEITGDSIRFVEVSERAGIYGGIAGYGLGLAIGDVDKNGYPDIYVGNDFHENDFLYLNQGDGTFIENANHSINHTSYFSMGNDWADINNDGWLDLMTLDMKPEDEVLFKSAQGPDPFEIYRFKRSFGYHDQFPQNTLQVHQGGNANDIRFSESAQLMGVSSTDWSWSVLMADLDLDGWKDLYITNGIPRRPNNLDYLKFISNREIQENASDLELIEQMPSGKISNYAFLNREGNYFQNQTAVWGMERPSISHGAAYADFDRDGDLDVVVNNLNEPVFFYQNRSEQLSANNYLMLRFKGTGRNTLGLGVSVSLYAGHQVQYQELYVTRGWQSCMDHVLSFGLGSQDLIDSMIVTWPDKKSEIRKNIKSNQYLVIDYKSATKKTDSPFKQSQSKDIFEYDKSQISFAHQENKFFDNTREPLMPFLLSTQGPKLSVADVNGDHHPDFYVGGASGQIGALYLQKSLNAFERGDSSAFLEDILCEDTGLAFLDVDGDGDQDLYIGSGGNQYYQDANKLRDRLYLNDGKGYFIKSTGALPEILEQTSCVKPYDYDLDGDIDLFVGSRSAPLFYGRSPNSYLLINDGTGHFKTAPKEVIDLTALGMVTDATWTDVDGDGLIDLVIVGDWMPITIFGYRNDKFNRFKPGRTSYGWWNTVVDADLDNDGDLDLVLGNFGLNSNLTATVQQPLKLYIGDFDANLTPDPIVTYFKQGKEYPLLGLDVLGSQMPFLKKKFRSYNEFAGKTIDEIFTREQLNQSARKHITTLQSSIAINDGHGNFILKDLPAIAQNSSVSTILIFDINYDDLKDILLAGNFYDIQPAIGRLDASFGTLLLGNTDGWFEKADSKSYNLSLSGQIRDLKLLDNNEEKMILVAKNDAPLQCITIKPPL